MNGNFWLPEILGEKNLKLCNGQQNWKLENTYPDRVTKVDCLLDVLALQSHLKSSSVSCTAQHAVSYLLNNTTAPTTYKHRQVCVCDWSVSVHVTTILPSCNPGASRGLNLQAPHPEAGWWSSPLWLGSLHTCTLKRQYTWHSCRGHDEGTNGPSTSQWHNTPTTAGQHIQG